VDLLSYLNSILHRNIYIEVIPIPYIILNPRDYSVSHHLSGSKSPLDPIQPNPRFPLKKEMQLVMEYLEKHL